MSNCARKRRRRQSRWRRFRRLEREREGLEKTEVYDLEEKEWAEVEVQGPGNETLLRSFGFEMSGADSVLVGGVKCSFDAASEQTTCARTGNALQIKPPSKPGEAWSLKEYPSKSSLAIARSGHSVLTAPNSVKGGNC